MEERVGVPDKRMGLGAGSVVIACLAGGIVGACLALLWAPKSGRETRKLIGDKTGELVKKGEELYGQARSRGYELIHQGKHFVGEQKEIVAAGIEAAREKAKKASRAA